MTAYFIVNCTITDRAKLEDYIGGAVASLGVVPVKLLAMDNESETVEGNPAGSRTVVYMIASWSLVIGVLKVVFGFKVRKLATAST